MSLLKKKRDPSLSISFLAKDSTECPACNHKFKVETILTGGGRFNTKNVTSELRRVYVPTKKYGLIYPLIYNVIVCPHCWFSSLPVDFKGKKYDMKKIIDDEENRKKLVKEMFDFDIDFTSNRSLEEGIVSYFLALLCYNYYKIVSIRTGHKVLSALRMAWCLDDYIEAQRGLGYGVEKWSYMAISYRKLALDSLEQHMDSMYHGKESFTEVEYHGPDLDHNYGYYGFVYLNSYLGFLFSDYGVDEFQEYKKLLTYRNNLAGVFGMGKVEKSSPSTLKNSARNSYDLIRNKIKELEAKNPNLVEEKDKKDQDREEEIT